MKRPADLNEREKRFVTAYIREPNGTKAAIAAGYSAKTAKVQASRLLTRARIKAEIQKWRIEVAEHTKIDSAYVLSQAVELYERCMASRPFNASGALRALELIGKHASVGAFKISEPASGERKHISLELQQFIFNAICGGREETTSGPRR